MTFNQSVCLLLLGLMTFSLGCGDSRSAVINEFKELNKTNVAKTRACFMVYASRNDEKAPASQEELVAFLKGGTVNKNLERIGIDPDSIDQIFVSERDGKPLKIKWGVKMDPDHPLPIAFETVGVEGVRLVAAEVLLEVDNDQEYEDLWNGKYESGAPQDGVELEVD